MRALARVSVLVLAVLMVGLVSPMPGRAADELSNGSVSQTEGTTSTVFGFSVDYNGGAGDLPTVTVLVANLEIGMQLESGLPDAGTYVASSNLPEGTWQVIFRADELRGPRSELAGPTITVQDPPPPTPAPTPTRAPTPRPTPVPTPVPTPTPSPTSTPTPIPTPRETPWGGVFTPSPTPTERPSEAPPEIEPASAAGAPLEFGPLAMLFIGGTMAGSGAAFLSVHWVATRERRNLARGLPPR